MTVSEKTAGPAATESGSPAVRRAVLSLGSNLGDRESTIRDALEDITRIPGVTVIGASGLVESHALTAAGVSETAPRYLNVVVVTEISITPEHLLDAVNQIEDRYGRVRAERWGDRTLDIDLVSVDNLIQQTSRLILPHPRAAERAFVLAPWLEVDPDAVIPGSGRVADLLGNARDRVWSYPAPPLIEAVNP